ncbi:hypothetical protein Avbf_05512 [Armadillidium vulgare]|nr:hypothetical protein Avbf_05512 [Armadillidium vulgare]
MKIFIIIWNLPILSGIKFGFSSIRSYLSLLNIYRVSNLTTIKFLEYNIEAIKERTYFKTTT